MAFWPHVNNKLPEVVAAVCDTPAETCDHDVPTPTWTGEDLPTTSFKPNWPEALSPHANNAPTDVMAKP